MTVEATETIAIWRAEIDARDERIITLLEERMTFSQQIQRSRMSGGGSRVAPAREQQIVERYASRLGDGGTELAVLVLEMSRSAAERAR